MTALIRVEEVMSLGKLFFESGYFQDAKTMAQAVVKIQAGQELGVSPFQSMAGIHIISGKPVIGSNLMASRVRSSGKYDYIVKQSDDKVCLLEFINLHSGKKLGESKFTIEDARKAGTKNIDRYPKNMLFARAMSNGVKIYCPDVFNVQVYVESEMAEIPDLDQGSSIIDAEVTEVESEVVFDKDEFATPILTQDIAKAETIDDLKNIFAKNKDFFTRNPSVKELLTDKKLEILMNLAKDFINSCTEEDELLQVETKFPDLWKDLSYHELLKEVIDDRILDIIRSKKKADERGIELKKALEALKNSKSLEELNQVFEQNSNLHTEIAFINFYEVQEKLRNPVKPTDIKVIKEQINLAGDEADLERICYLLKKDGVDPQIIKNLKTIKLLALRNSSEEVIPS